MAKGALFFSIFPEYCLVVKAGEWEERPRAKDGRLVRTQTEKEVSLQFYKHRAILPFEFVELAKTRSRYGIDFIEGQELREKLDVEGAADVFIHQCEERAGMAHEAESHGIMDITREIRKAIEPLKLADKVEPVKWNK